MKSYGSGPAHHYHLNTDGCTNTTNSWEMDEANRQKKEHRQAPAYPAVAFFRSLSSTEMSVNKGQSTHDQTKEREYRETTEAAITTATGARQQELKQPSTGPGLTHISLHLTGQLCLSRPQYAMTKGRERCNMTASQRHLFLLLSNSPHFEPQPPPLPPPPPTDASNINLISFICGLTGDERD